MLMRINNQSDRQTDRQTNYAIRIPILDEEEEKGLGREEKGLRRGGEGIEEGRREKARQ